MFHLWIVWIFGLIFCLVNDVIFAAKLGPIKMMNTCVTRHLSHETKRDTRLGSREWDEIFAQYFIEILSDKVHNWKNSLHVHFLNVLTNNLLMNVISSTLWVWFIICIEIQQYTSTVKCFATNSTDWLFSYDFTWVTSDLTVHVWASRTSDWGCVYLPLHKFNSQIVNNANIAYVQLIINYCFIKA